MATPQKSAHPGVGGSPIGLTSPAVAGGIRAGVACGEQVGRYPVRQRRCRRHTHTHIDWLIGLGPPPSPRRRVCRAVREDGVALVPTPFPVNRSMDRQTRVVAIKDVVLRRPCSNFVTNGRYWRGRRLHQVRPDAAGGIAPPPLPWHDLTAGGLSHAAVGLEHRASAQPRPAPAQVHLALVGRQANPVGGTGRVRPTARPTGVGSAGHGRRPEQEARALGAAVVVARPAALRGALDQAHGRADGGLACCAASGVAHRNAASKAA